MQLPAGGSAVLALQAELGAGVRVVSAFQNVSAVHLKDPTHPVDCDVLEADGGTRTAAITGAYVALADALFRLRAQGRISGLPLKDFVAATSVGIVDGQILLDLCYAEDSIADVDMNVVMTGSGKIVEVQGTAEDTPFDRTQMDEMLTCASGGIQELITLQRRLVAERSAEAKK